MPTVFLILLVTHAKLEIVNKIFSSVVHSVARREQRMFWNPHIDAQDSSQGDEPALFAVKYAVATIHLPPAFVSFSTSFDRSFVTLFVQARKVSAIKQAEWVGLLS